MAISPQKAMYEGAIAMASTYLTLSGQCGLIPGGPDGTPAAVVKAHGRVQWRVITFTVTRVGAPPAAPPPEDLDADNILLSAQVGVPAPLPIATAGMYAITLMGTYVYLVVRPLGEGDDLPSGRLPVDSAAASDNAYPASAYDGTLVGRSGGTRRG